MRRLIINADDFGLTRGVNLAIGEAHDSGLVTSATLMAVSQCFEDAVSIAKSRPRLGVGCHTVLVDGEPLTSATSLRRKNGDLHYSITSFARSAILGGLNADDVAAEALAQMRKIKSSGLELTHLDTHKHTHMFPAVFRGLLQAAKEFGVQAIRNPFVPFEALTGRRLLGRPRFWVRYAETRLLRGLLSGFERAIKDAGLKTTCGSFGVIATGGLDQKLFLEILDAVPEGTWEFICHPGHNDAELDGIRTRLRASREIELRLLTSPASKERISARGIELINFSDL